MTIYEEAAEGLDDAARDIRMRNNDGPSGLQPALVGVAAALESLSIDPDEFHALYQKVFFLRRKMRTNS